MKKSIALLIAVCVVATTVFAACNLQSVQAKIVYMADGKVFEIQKVTSSTDAPIDDEPEKKGYEFVGWYEDEDGRRRFDFDDYFASEDKEDVVVYAKFEEADDSEDAPVGDPDRIDPHWMNGYRVGYVAGDAANNTIDLSKVFPDGSDFQIADSNIATVDNTTKTLTTLAAGDTTLYYDTEGAENATEVVMHVMDGYTNVDTWDELYNAVMIEGEVANVCVQSDLTAVANKAFAFVPNDSPDYAGYAPSPDTLNLYGNMFTWDTSAITKAGTHLFRIDWCEKTINVTDVYMKGAEPVLDDNGNMDLTQFEGGGAFFSATGSNDVTPVFNITHCITENTQKHISVRSAEVNLKGSIVRNGADALVAAETYSGSKGAVVNVENSVLANSVVCGIILWSTCGEDVKSENDYCEVNLSGFVDFYTWKNRESTKLMPGNDPSGAFVANTVNTLVQQSVGKKEYDKYFVKQSDDAPKSEQYLNIAIIRLSSGKVDPNASEINGFEKIGLYTADFPLPSAAYAIIKNCDLYGLDPKNADFSSDTWTNPTATPSDNPNLEEELLNGRKA